MRRPLRSRSVSWRISRRSAGPGRDPRKLAIRQQVGLKADHAARVDALYVALIDREDARVLTSQHAEESQQVLLVQQPEPQLHDRLPKRKRTGAEFTRI